jgi:ABC-type sugar transport system ATPase subunit
MKCALPPFGKIISGRAMPRKTISDTITVTADGRTIVDIPKLLAKEHIQKMIHEMRSKTRVASKPEKGYTLSRQET